MPIGRTKEEQELTAMIRASIVEKEVLEPMNKIGWGHSAPPPPDYGTTPPTEGAPAPAKAPDAAPQAGQPAPVAPAAPQPDAQAKADAPAEPTDIVQMFESLREPNGLIMGKYKTVQEALKGAGHLANMAKQAFTERDTFQKKLEAIQTGTLEVRPQPVATSPATVSAPVTAELASSREALARAQAKLDGVLSGIEEDGNVLTAEDLKKVGVAQREVAELAAEVRLQETLLKRDSAQTAERQRWTAVDEHMSKHHPESLTHADEIGLFVQSDPMLQDAIGALVAQGKEIRASELAWTQYQKAVLSGEVAKVQANAEAKEADLAAKEQVRQELLEKARKDAGVIQGSAGGQGVHQGANVGASNEELASLAAQMRMEGEAPGSPAAVKFRHLIIGRHLDPSIFGGSQ